MKEVCKLVVVLLFLFCIPVVLADQVLSSATYASGESISLGNAVYTILLSDSSNNAILRSNDGAGIFLSVGQCFVKNQYKVCLDTSPKRSGQQLLADLSIHLFQPKINISVTKNPFDGFLLDDVQLTLSARGDEQHTLQDFTLDAIIPRPLEVISSTCTNSSTSQLSLFQLKKDSLQPNEFISCTLRLTSASQGNYSLLFPYEFIFQGTSTIGNEPSIDVAFTSPLVTTGVFSSFNHTNPFTFNVTLNNSLTSRLTQVETRMYVPKEISIRKKPSSFNILSDETIESSLYQVLRSTTSLDENEGILFEFEFKGDVAMNNSFFLRHSFPYKNRILETPFRRFDFELKAFPQIIEVRELCDGSDFIIDSSLNMTSVQFFQGNSFETILYLQSKSKEPISFANILIKDHFENVLFQGIRSFTELQKFNLVTVSETIPFTFNSSTYDIFFTVSYLCNESKKQFTFNETLSIPVKRFDDIILSKRLSASSVLSNEVIRVDVDIENPSSANFSNLRIKETIPENFSVEGITSRTLTLRENQKETIYSFFLTAPSVEREESFVLASIMDVPLLNDTLTFTIEHDIIVSPNYNVSLDARILSEEGIFYVNEPRTFQILIENKDEKNFARNVILEISQETSFDSSLHFKDVGTLPPLTSETIEVLILPRKNNVSFGFNLSFDNLKGNSVLIEKDKNVTFLSPRIQLPSIVYTIDEVLDIPSSKTIITYRFENTGLQNKTFSYFDGVEKVLKTLPSQSKESIELEFEELPSRLSVNHSLVSYSFLGTTYYVFPQERSFVRINPSPPPRPQDESSQNQNPSEPQDIVELEETTLSLTKIVLFSLFIIFVLGSITVFLGLHLHKKHHKNDLTPKEIERIEKEPLKESHIMDDDDSIGKKSSKDHSSPKNNSSKEDSLKPSNIFSFDEYEKLKEELDKKYSSHKK